MTVFKGGSRNPRNYLFSGEFQERVQTMNRLQPIGQLKQSIKGHPLVTKRITRGAQSAAQNTAQNAAQNAGYLITQELRTMLLPNGKCRNSNPDTIAWCGNCYNGTSVCGNPCIDPYGCPDPSQ